MEEQPGNTGKMHLIWLTLTMLISKIIPGSGNRKRDGTGAD